MKQKLLLLCLICNLDICAQRIDFKSKSEPFPNNFMLAYIPIGAIAMPYSRNGVNNFLYNGKKMGGEMLQTRMSHANYKSNISANNKARKLDEDNKIPQNDFLLFAGSNIDPNNDKSAVTSTSFEAIAKFEFNNKFHMRIGGYSYKNFSSDSGSISPTIPKHAYINTNPGIEPKIDTTRLLVQQFSLGKRTTTRSYGVYIDQYFTLANDENAAFRVSAYIRYEYAFRKIESVISEVNSKILDTLTFNRSMQGRNIIIQNTLISKDNVFPVNQNINQHYFITGMTVEYSCKEFDIFFQPMVGYVVTFQEYSSRPLITKKGNGTLGIKLQASIKVLDVNLAADFRDLNTPRPFINISIGIPISFSKLKEKFS